MLEGNEQQPQRGLKGKILDALRKRNILPQQKKVADEPQITTSHIMESRQPYEVEERTAITVPLESPSAIDQKTLTSPGEIKPVPEQPIDRIRQLIRARVPEQVLNPENIDSFDSLFLSQLWENVNRSDAFRYTRTAGEEAVYALPFEMRQFDGVYYPFIPRVENWHYIRSLPVWGEHSPLAETYEFTAHTYAVKLKDMLQKRGAMITYKTLGQYFNEQDPELIGEKHGKKTPFHKMFLSENGITLELQVDLTIEQTKKLESMRDRLSHIIPVNLQIKHKEATEPLPAPLEMATEMPLDFIDFSENSIPVNKDRAVEVKLTPSHRLLVKAHHPATASPMVYGYGYIQEELRRKLASSSRHVVVFFFDQTARRHSESLGGFALSQIPPERWKVRKEDDIDKQLRSELPEIDTEKVLPDVWHLRPEIITDALPYTLSIDELQIPCGFRAMMNTETGELTVEVLSDGESVDDPIKRTILERTAGKAAEALKQRGGVFVRPPRRPHTSYEVKSTVLRVLPVAV